MNTGFYTNPIYLEHDTGSHPENANRLRAIQEKLESEGLLERLILQSGRSATSQEIKLLHSEKLISAVEAAAESGARTLHTPDCIISAQTFNAAAHAVGSVLDGVIEVAERRLDNAFCAVRPPGHHAENDSAMGFCFFNNIALAAEFLTREMGFKRVLIFDFDVHHGNGTQHFFEERPIYFLPVFIRIHAQVFREQVLPMNAEVAEVPDLLSMFPFLQEWVMKNICRSFMIRFNQNWRNTSRILS